MPSTPAMERPICVARAYIRLRSSPKSLMAMLAFVPESMASIRCEMGWPTSTVSPFRSPSRWRTSARNSSRERLSSTNGASSSDAFTPRACSSSSARPVLRATVCISGISRRISSTIRPMRSDSSSDTPGIVATLMVSEPSLKGGRKLLPKVLKTMAAPTKRVTTPASTVLR